MGRARLLLLEDLVGLTVADRIHISEFGKLDGSDGARYILRYDRFRDEWEIQVVESRPPMAGS